MLLCSRTFLLQCHKMIRELAKRLSSPSRTHLTMLTKGISRTHSFFRPHISHAFYGYGLRCFALKAVSSTPASSELTLETAASLNAISASKKKKVTSKTKKLDSANILLTPNPNSVPGVQIDQIPIYSYKHCKPLPTVVYTQHEEEANELIAGLKAGPIAFDMEWRLYFRRAKNATKSTLVDRRTAVVQVADSNGLILLIQIYNMSRFPTELQLKDRFQSLIENPEIPKIGVNILNDGKKLFRDYGVLAQNLVELGALALLVDPAGSQERSKSKRRIVSLVKLVQWYCGMEVEKGKERVGNWELKLENQQIDYAANDVHSTMAVYQKLCNFAQLNAISLTDNKSAFTSDVEMSPSEIVESSSSSSEIVESSSSEIVESPSSSSEISQDRDQSNQSSSTSSVYGRLIRGVLGFKALLRAFFVKP